MTKRHDHLFDAVLSGVPRERDQHPTKDRAGARFLKRGTAISERMSGQAEEKTLLWVDPTECRMWERHNRDYDLLNEDTCRDLIDGIKSQGRQEFPAIVRKVDGPEPYEVICGARRHYAISWLRENNYPQFKYLIDVRDLSDEEAFRLADIENRDREDISDYERAVDYAQAIELYYGGKQKAMAERLEVSEAWLSRYLNLAHLPEEIVTAFPSIRDIKELHARTLKPLLRKPADRRKVLARAVELGQEQAQARAGQGRVLDATKVMAALKASVQAPKPRSVKQSFSNDKGDKVLTFKQSGRTCQIEFSAEMSREDFEQAMQRFLSARY